jgi:16S rRNA (cytosine967-C5)-methyltransferase
MTAPSPQRHAGHAPTPPGLRPESLAYALDGAARAVGMLRAGTTLPAALAAVHAKTASPAARGAIQDIAFRTTRRLALADAWLAALVRKAPPAHVGNVLRCAFALLADDEPRRAYPAFTIVDQAVDAIAARRDLAHTKGLVNAVLRNAIRSRDALIADAGRDPVTRWNYPQWWIDAVSSAWPNDAERVLAAGNAHAPLTLRVNRRRTDVERYLETLRDAGIAAVHNAACADTAVTLREPLPVDKLPGFADGVVSVQDAGAQCAAALLGVRDGMRVLDACAAPGGKTGHLLESADIELIALESDATRAARIGENLARLGLSATVKIGDAGRPDLWHDGQPFDRVLADVPCSASGIVRRHPDVRWLRRASDIAALVDEQRRIVQALWPLVARGGELLYVTCSIFPDEGERQARWFERVLEDAVRLGAPGQLLPTVAGSRDPLDDRCGAGSDFDHDGFFYARFQKR